MRYALLFLTLLGCTPQTQARETPAGAVSTEGHAAIWGSAAPGPERTVEPPAATDEEALARARVLRTDAVTIELRPPADHMTRALRERVAILQASTPLLTRLKGSSDPSMVVQGWHLEAALAWELAQALRLADAPEMTAEQAAIYREAIDEKCGLLETAARISFAECAAFARACRGSDGCTLDAEAQAAAQACESP